MRSSVLLALGALASSAAALTLTKRDEPAYVDVPFVKQHVKNAPLQKRAFGVSVDVDKRNEGFLYWVNYTIGTPPVDLYAVVDTGSSDLLVLTDSVVDCQQNASTCHGGIMDPKKSSTWQWSDEQVTGAFGSHEEFAGNYAADTLGIGGVSIKDFIFAGVTEYQAAGNGIISIFGIGLQAGEHDTLAGGQGYNNLVYALAKAGSIKSPAYSMHLTSLNEGNFLFGAVDKSKYKEPLVTFDIPVDNQADAKDRLTIVQTGFAVSKDGKTNSFDFTPRPVLLDSGTEKTALPLDVFEYFLEQVGGAWDPTEQSFTAPCYDKDVTVDFTFSELTISVPASDLMIAIPIGAGIDGKQWCFVQYDEGMDNLILGDDFLRSAYIVYDYANLQVSIANVNNNGGAANIFEIGDTVPDAVHAVHTPTEIAPEFQTPNPAITDLPADIPLVTITSFASEPTGSDSGSGSGSSKSDDGDSAGVRHLPVTSAILLISFIVGVLVL